MADEDDKTEEPTGKRVDEARKKGDVVKSADCSQGLTLLVGIVALYLSGGFMMRGIEQIMVECFRAIPDWRVTNDSFQAFLLPGFLHVLRLIAPVSLAVVVAALLYGVSTTGFLFTMDVLSPDFAKLFSPAALMKFVSVETWMNLAKSFLKMSAIAIVGIATVWPSRGAFLEMAAWPLAAQFAFTLGLAWKVLLRMALFLLVLGVVDLFWQMYRRHEKLKMSKQEVKDEARQSDGDPLVKNKIRQIRREMFRRFMMREVPKATVVVTNPTHFAVALRYRQGVDRAPVVVAKGADHMAARIRELAREGGVPIIENPPLARALHAQVEPGDEVPADLYAAVAELLALVLGVGRGRQVPMAPRPAILALAFSALLSFSGCSFFDDPAARTSSAEIRLSDGSGQYRGGDLVVRAYLSLCGSDPQRLTWSTGRAVVLDRGQTFNEDGDISMDSLVLRWDSVPKSKDSTQLFRDTVALYLDGVPLASFELPLKNVLPLLDSVQAGRALDSGSMRTLPLHGDTILVAVRPGEYAYIRMCARDPDKNYPAQFRMGLPMAFAGGGSLDRRNGDVGDSVLLWRSPSNLFDTTVACTLFDGLGQGKRRWLMRLSTYEERGSVWAGIHSSLAKFGISQGGRIVEVARLSGFLDVSSLDIDPSREGGVLLVADHVAGKVAKYTSEGMARTVSVATNRPRSLACDADAGFCWLGDQDSSGRGRLSRFDGGSASFASLPAGITTISVDQGAAQRAWFSSVDSGFVGRTTGGRLDTLVRGQFRRVKGISWDDSVRLLWVVDEASGSLVAMDSSFRKVRIITGLDKPGAVSASGGRVWVAETGAGNVRLYSSAGVLLKTLSGFSGPQGVVAVPQTPDRAWVADTENGRLVLVSRDSVLGSTAGQGLGRPSVLAVHRGAP